MAKGGRRARAGRPPKPTAQKILQGTFRKDRHGKEIEVEPSTPITPAGLSPEEQKTWDELMRLTAPWLSESDGLAALGVVSLVDRLQRNIEYQRTHAKSPVFVNKRSRIVGGSREVVVEVRESPLISQEVKLWRELRAYLAIMGLSPVDRARVPKDDSGKAQPLSPLASFLKRHGSA